MPNHGKHGDGKWSAAERDKRRAEIRALIRRVGWHAMDWPRLAEHYKVDPATIYNDRKVLAKEVPKERVNDLNVNLLMRLESVERNVDRLSNSTNENVRLGAEKLKLQILNATLDLTERLGLKPPTTPGTGAPVHVVSVPDELRKVMQKKRPQDDDDADDPDEPEEG